MEVRKLLFFLFCLACFNFSFFTDLFPPLFSALVCILQPAGWVRYVCAAGCEVVTQYLLLLLLRRKSERQTNKKAFQRGTNLQPVSVCVFLSDKCLKSSCSFDSRQWKRSFLTQKHEKCCRALISLVCSCSSGLCMWKDWYRLSLSPPSVSMNSFCADVKEAQTHEYFITLQNQRQESDDTHTHTHNANTLLDLYWKRCQQQQRERKKQKWKDSLAAVLIVPPLGVTDSSYFFCQADKKKAESHPDVL